MGPRDRLYTVQRALFRWLKPRTRGVKVMVFDAAGRILLIRNTYGNTRAYMFPGGGVDLLETPVAAARREVLEEARCRVDELAEVGVFTSELEGKRDTIWLFRTRTADAPQPDLSEIAEAAFFPIDALPETTSPATRRRIQELQGVRTADTRW